MTQTMENLYNPQEMDAKIRNYTDKNSGSKTDQEKWGNAVDDIQEELSKSMVEALSLIDEQN